MTAELKWGKYVYDRCTGFKGCGNTYVGEESQRLADAITRIQISADVTDWITEALRERQDDKQKVHRASVMGCSSSTPPSRRRSTARPRTGCRAMSRTTCGSGRRSSGSERWPTSAATRRCTSPPATITPSRGQDSRTRANRTGSIRYAESCRTSANAENAAFELHVRSPKSFSCHGLSRSTCWPGGMKTGIGWVSGTIFVHAA